MAGGMISNQNYNLPSEEFYLTATAAVTAGATYVINTATALGTVDLLPTAAIVHQGAGDTPFWAGIACVCMASAAAGAKTWFRTEGVVDAFVGNTLVAGTALALDDNSTTLVAASTLAAATENVKVIAIALQTGATGVRTKVLFSGKSGFGNFFKET